MADGLDVEAEVRKQAGKVYARWKARAVHLWRGWGTAALLKVTGTTALGVLAAALAYPPLTVALIALGYVLLLVYAIVATRLLKGTHSTIRWAYVDGKRVRQKHLEHQMATQEVILALAEGRQAKWGRGVSADLRSALAMHTHRLHQLSKRVEAAEAVKEGTATARQVSSLRRFQRGDVAPPTGPDVGSVRARLEVLKAERDQLEAEIQALATADTVDQAMKAEEVAGTRRKADELRAASRAADKAARENVMRGRTATQEESGMAITVARKANGDIETGRTPSPPTPEQIARGDTGS